MKKNQSGLQMLLGGGLAYIAYDYYYRRTHKMEDVYPYTQALIAQENYRESEISWVGEQNYARSMHDIVLPTIMPHQIKGQYYIEGITLDYHYYDTPNNIGTIVIVHGYNEFKEKYYETVYYFMQMGYSVLVYDQRGHGFSKSDQNNLMIDVNDFNRYLEDLEGLLNQLKTEGLISLPIHLFGHSMGGAVALNFAHDHTSWVKSLILSSPMIGIDTHPFPNSFTQLFVDTAKLLNFERKPIPFRDFGNDELHRNYYYDPHLTQSLKRGHYYHYLNGSLHLRPTRGGSLRWLHASLAELERLTNRQFLSEVQLPVLLFVSHSDAIVRNSAIYHAANYLPEVSLYRVQPAGHEIYIEKDEIIRPYYQKIHDFLAFYA